MENITDVIGWLDSYVSSHPIFIALLLGTGIFFTIYLRFPQVRHFRRAIEVLRGKHDVPEAKGDASHFQALSTALSGTVGTGNIAGVAMAIHWGGPAALFWMLLTAIIGMATKFSEVTLSHKYRTILPDGTVAGGPMFYMKKRLNFLFKGRVIPIGTVMACIFAFCTMISAFGTGALPQINSIATAVNASTGISNHVIGIVMAILLGMVTLGGIRRIVKVTEKLVPFMGILYVLCALIVIICNIGNLPSAIASIFCDVFTGSAAAGGFLGASVALALGKGVNRGLFSNEAGQGSAPIAHATARTTVPAKEGLVALLEPFIDTVIICMLTGTMILCTGAWKTKYDNVFQEADVLVLNKTFENSWQVRDAMTNDSLLFNGKLKVLNGRLPRNVTMLHAQSVAEDVKVLYYDEPFTGRITVANGKISIPQNFKITGKSLIHSAPLTIKAIETSILGGLAQYIVSLSLLLFAFSTTIAWSYYGDRASTFLFGPKSILIFRLLYIAGFALGAFIDTQVVWSIASITVVTMAVPNLIGMLCLHKEIKQEERTLLEI